MNTSESRRWLGPLVLLIAGGLLLAAAALVSFANQTDRNTPATVIDPVDGVARVPVQDALIAYQQGTAVLIDVRSSSSFESAHIPGSISIPLSEVAANAGELNPDDWVITICA